MSSATKSMPLSESLEDYLETIFRIVQDKQAARPKDVADRLKVGRSSVTGALRALAERKLINYAPYDLITLTDKGHHLAAEVNRRHEILLDFFVKVLSIDPDEADSVACRMEHTIPEHILQRFTEFIEFSERCPNGSIKWISGYGYFRDTAHHGSGCEKCSELSKMSAETDSMSDNPTEKKPAITLSTIKPGKSATIVKIHGSGGIRRRLLDMGATAGTLVNVERIAPLGDPIDVKIKGYHLTLRKEEAARIEVTPL